MGGEEGEGGGRACLLATRVSRSVRLSVCEAVIRFQDFPSVTVLLTKPCAPLHTEATAKPPSPPDLLHSQRCYTSAGRSCTHLQPHPKNLLAPTENLNLTRHLIFFIRFFFSPHCFRCKMYKETAEVHGCVSTLQWFASTLYASGAVSFFLSGSLLFLYLCLLSPPSPLPLPWMAGQAVSCAGSEEVRTPRCTLIMKGLSRPPQTDTHTLARSHSRTHSPHRHGDGTSPALSPGGKLGI